MALYPKFISFSIATIASDPLIKNYTIRNYGEKYGIKA